MGMSWTTEQQQVIDLRNCNILVAAAAGSGKTAVLVERIITRLTKDENPLNVDELLIVTFTEAAAAEMKERILIAIEKALGADPSNQHLQMQATLIHRASIMTIHSFCLGVIKDYFHTIDLDPVFRIGEEGELKLLKQDTMAQVLEEEYARGCSQFHYFVESVAPGKSDKPVEELIFSLYEFSRSNPQPRRWLESCIAQYACNSIAELEASPVGQFLQETIQFETEELMKCIQRAITISLEVGGPHHYVEALQADEAQLQYLLNIFTANNSENQGCVLELVAKLIKGWEWAPLSRKRPKDVEAEKRELVKGIRDDVKKVVKGWSEKYFYVSLSQQLQDMKISKGLVEELVRLVNAFADAFDREKKARSIIDFNDMEQYALQILTAEDSETGALVPTVVAKEYQEKFAEIMIDEYQDSNLVQEAILTSVSKETQGAYNIFRVGDVKQSIYRFRLSRPELFMEKFHTYSITEGEKRRIDLSKNFRSRREVLDATNYIFYQIMHRYLGDVEYDDKAALYYGADFGSEEVVDNQAELLLLDDKERKEAEGVKENSRELEARLVARRIKELIHSHRVYDRNTGEHRKVQYRDIVLLTRSLSGWSDVFAEGLNAEGIPTSVASRDGYFSTMEVALLLDYLKVLDNPKQDIPLTAVLHSVFGGLSDKELAIIKGTYRDSTFYEAVEQFAQCEQIEEIKKQHVLLADFDIEEIQRRLQQCLQQLEGFRKKVSYLGIHELLWEILQVTGYRAYVYALPGGEQRRANIEMLLEKATAFEKTSYKGIFNFIRYIEQLQKYEVEYGEANMVDEMDDAVRIMSIHKSKGLEFPIVFVIGMGKQFNKQDLRGCMAVHPDAGIGMDAINPQKRTKMTVLNKQIMKKKLEMESLGEELRVLYVALTRAKEKLIMTGKVTDLEKYLRTLETNQNATDSPAPALGFLDLVTARTYLDWVLPSVYGKMQAPVQVEAIALEKLVEQEMVEEIASDIQKEEIQELSQLEARKSVVEKELSDQFNFQYPFQEEAQYKTKMSVTEIKKRTQLMEQSNEDAITWEDIEKSYKMKSYTKVVPKFIESQSTECTSHQSGAYRGTAFHRFMELWDFTKVLEEVQFPTILQEWIYKGQMTQEQVDCIPLSDVQCFMKSPIASRMYAAAQRGELYKEQPFVLGVPAKQVYGGETTETVLVQGIIDVYFVEGEKIILMDYKTDHIKSEQELVRRYHAQLEYYAQALTQLTGKTVEECFIYSSELGKSILAK